ncbi:MAG TPA: c-type cytochrome [Usitatibacter sp.]|nr:c-type cytochrome [Usitatibacter sp.]
MKHLFKAAAIALAAGSLVVATGAAAQSGADLLKAKGCLGCHDFEKKKVGPAFKDVAAKNQGKEDQLVAKVSGAKGHPKVNATEEEVRKAVEQVLKTK